MRSSRVNTLGDRLPDPEKPNEDDGVGTIEQINSVQILPTAVAVNFDYFDLLITVTD
jgi:hypothetical protein